jgi:hypothetical protein
MDAAWAAESRLTPEAAEFVRFCYGRRRVGWPELYDEMCAVASRGLFRGWGPDDLAEHGIGFGLFELPALAALVAKVVAEEPPVARRGRQRTDTGPGTRLGADGARAEEGRSEPAATLRAILAPAS